MGGVAVAGGFRDAGASLLAVAPFPVAAHRTQRADFPHWALQWDHAPRTRASCRFGRQLPGKLTGSACSGMARPQPTVPFRFGLAIKPVYASMAPDRSMVVVHRLVRALRLCMRCLPGFPARFGVIGIATPKTLLPFSIPPHLRPLPSADVTRRLQYYGPLRHPDRPGLSLAGFRLVRATPPTGLPVLPPSPSSMRAAATTPVEPAGARVARFPRG